MYVSVTWNVIIWNNMKQAVFDYCFKMTAVHREPQLLWLVSGQSCSYHCVQRLVMALVLKIHLSTISFHFSGKLKQNQLHMNTDKFWFNVALGQTYQMTCWMAFTWTMRQGVAHSTEWSGTHPRFQVFLSTHSCCSGVTIAVGCLTTRQGTLQSQWPCQVATAPLHMVIQKQLKMTWIGLSKDTKQCK